LVISDLFVSEGGVPSGARRSGEARFRCRPLPPGGWRAMLAQWLGRADLLAATPAQILTAAARGAAIAIDDPVRIATPLHCVAGLDRVHLPSDGLLRLAMADLQDLVRAFEQQFAADGLQLEAVAETLLLHGLVDDDARTHDPARWLGRDLREAGPTGASALFRRRNSEIEMWLHALPLNARRQSQGQPPITHLWLWGDAALRHQSESLPPQGDLALRSPVALYSDEAFATALAGLAQLPVAAIPSAATVLASTANTVVVVAGGASLGDLPAVERDWLAPALQALERSSLRELWIVASDRLLSVAAGQQWHFWRPRQTWLEALGEDSLALPSRRSA